MTVQCIGPASWPRVRPWQDAFPTVAGAQGPAIQRALPNACMPRAQSVDAMAMLMLDGRLDISAYRGRERLERGALALRPTFDCRALQAGPGGAVWLQLPWQTDCSLGATYDLADVDDILLRVGQGLADALGEMQATVTGLVARPPLRLHWIDDLKSAILLDPHLSISDWARTHRVSREGAARAFRVAYAVGPARFRLELRARRAWARIVSDNEALSRIALETGFADQSHMTRAVGWLTGRSPSAWRRRH